MIKTTSRKIPMKTLREPICKTNLTLVTKPTSMYLLRVFASSLLRDRISRVTRRSPRWILSTVLHSLTTIGSRWSKEKMMATCHRMKCRVPRKVTWILWKASLGFQARTNTMAVTSTFSKTLNISLSSSLLETSTQLSATPSRSN
jgi:hypothetical protein